MHLNDSWEKKNLEPVGTANCKDWLKIIAMLIMSHYICKGQGGVTSAGI